MESSLVFVFGTLIEVFRGIRTFLASVWRVLRSGIYDLPPGHRHLDRPYSNRLTPRQEEQLEIECYIGPYAEPFRAESLKAYAAKIRKDLPGTRVVPPCEREGETAHLYAMNGLCVLCGVDRGSLETAKRERKARDTVTDCLGDLNREAHHWRTFRDIGGSHTKCLDCGVRQERTAVRGGDPRVL